MLGNYSEAHDLYERLSKTKQYSSASTFYNAYIEYANERYDNAMDLFEKVDRVGELGYQSQYYMCQIMYKQGDYNNAVNLGESLIEDNANDYFTAEINRIVPPITCSVSSTSTTVTTRNRSTIWLMSLMPTMQWHRVLIST